MRRQKRKVSSEARAAANDNAPRQRMVTVLMTADLPIQQAEVEVFDLLIGDFTGEAANDNDPPPGRRVA